MARCTAPRYGHRTASGRDACPACGSSGSRSYSSYSSYSTPYSSYESSSASNRSGGGQLKSHRARWSKAGSNIFYTPAEIRTLTPVRQIVEERASIPDLRDIFLCHAWDDRQGAAKELHDSLEALGVSVWFSEKDVALGSSLLREIDKGLVKSRIGIVMVTPSFLKRVKGEGIANKELAVLLARDLLVPIMHNTSFEELLEVSPMLASKSGLSTKEDSMMAIAAKLSELVEIEAVF